LNRRDAVLALMALSTAARSSRSMAQVAGKVWRVAYLSPVRRIAAPHLEEAFRQAMLALGYVEGKNILFDVRYAENQFERLPGLAAELVALKPDAILAVATVAISAAQKATSTVPIVMCPATDPVGSGFIANFARPGGNITGVVNMNADLSVKLLQILHKFAPKIKRIAVLTMAGNPTHMGLAKDIQEAARTMGLVSVPIPVTAAAELEGAFSAIAKAGCGAVVVLPDPLFVGERQRLADLCTKARLPAVYRYREHVEAGGLVSYGSNLPALYRRAAFYVDKIFKGTKPGEIPVEQPTVFELYINGRTAKALGLKIPPELILQADRMVE